MPHALCPTETRRGTSHMYMWLLTFNHRSMPAKVTLVLELQTKAFLCLAALTQSNGMIHRNPSRLVCARNGIAMTRWTA